MAKGFRRQGEWQTGYSQRNIASNVKKQLQTVKLLEQKIKEEALIKKFYSDHSTVQNLDDSDQNINDKNDTVDNEKNKI